MYGLERDSECTDYSSLLNGLGEPVNGFALMILEKKILFLIGAT